MNAQENISQIIFDFIKGNGLPTKMKIKSEIFKGYSPAQVFETFKELEKAKLIEGYIDVSSYDPLIIIRRVL